MDLSKISFDLRGAAFKVFNNLGPGLFESVYETALIYELRELGYKIDSQVSIPIVYADIKIKNAFKIDLVIENKIIVELKSVDKLAPIHYKQVLTYLKLANLKLGFLINFNTNTLDKNSLVRLANNF